MNCWIPNFLTLSRILLLPPVMLLMQFDTPAARWFALGLFLVASLIDALDGWAARRLGCTGNIGIFLDPLASSPCRASVAWRRAWAWSSVPGR